MPTHNPIDSRVFQVVTASPADPAAGADFSWSVPANSRVEIISVVFEIVADGTAANRQAQVNGNDGTYDFQFSVAPGVQTAGETIEYQFAIDNDPTDLSGAYQLMTCKLAEHMILDPGDSFDSSILNLQAADQIQNIVIRFRQWVYP